ncbi:SpoIIE family protein phosphatase [Tunturiibacter empetritectus]|uniref:Heme/copper-type cytochrome/quinol oxidase subunit 4 n=1 Tax=Tunturiibacter lichenicola TaxID=2051959 RepID=A0A852VPC6_9BACT|nr:SpoIIE family protein phosphatase [Edaphobacter lichenicola]NYF91222.1 heme/copper-type cytochrome/quinol oxidase subunit 4 [Edaphobacter lichenicola]
MRRARVSTVLLLLFGFAVGLRGEKPKSAPAPRVQLEATLGDSTVELSGLWKFHIGDDMAWAQPDFDDSSWGTIDLTPPAGSANPELGSSGYIPGWTANGYPKHTGFAWYRLRVNVQSSHGRLAIKMPNEVDDAYQLYVNGQLLGELGKFGEHRTTAYSTLPREFRLPRELRNGPITIAVRIYMDSASLFLTPDAGGMHEPPVLGHAGVIGTLIQMDWDNTAHVVGSGFLEMLILLLAWMVAVSLLSMDRTEPSYLWLSLVCAVTILGNGVVLIVSFVPWIALTPGIFLQSVIINPIRIGLWVIFWGYWFRISQMQWVHRIVWGLVALTMIGTAMMSAPIYGEHIPVHASVYLLPILLGLRLSFAALLCAITFRGIRKQKTEGWLALSAVVLVAVALFQVQLRLLLHIPTAFNILGFDVQLGTISTIFSLFLITVMLVRRFLQTQRIREQWKAEIEQARQIQHVLIPEHLPQTPGLAIESEYRPAREVGGDFFQILPVQEDGSVLIVVGDVTGKGLQAGMLVALIVGAIRTAVQYDSDPLILMNSLNDRLWGRGRASATCLILQICTDGRVTLANAGHLPPYLNGAEVEMGGSLPIGVVPGAEFFVSHFKLEPGDTLMLMSDGVAEAQDQEKQLFGFERIEKMLQQPISAAELASAAQDFGQEDDILVLRIQRRLQPENVPDEKRILTAM